MENVETVTTENVQEAVKEPTDVNSTETKVEESTTAEGKKSNSTEVLRELSKQFSVNLFDENGLTMLKEKLDIKDSEYNTLKTQHDETLKKAQLFEQKEQEYVSKIEALGMGFQSDQIDEVIKLAKVYTDEGQPLSNGLQVVKEKYGGVFATKKNIGLQMNDVKGDKPNLPRTEQEQYMASSPAVQKWNKMTKK